MLSAQFDRDLIEEVLNRTERREKRSRRLPAKLTADRRQSAPDSRDFH